MKQMSDATSNVIHLPTLQSETEDDRPSWAIAATNALGVTMPNSNQPRGWSVNPATVTLTLIVAFLLISGAYYQGVRDTETRELIDKLEKIEKTAQQAKDLSLSKAAQIGHAENTNTEVKK